MSISLAPELVGLFTQALSSPVTVAVRDHKRATAIRHRLNRIRRDLKKYDHPLASTAELLTIRLEDKADGTACLIIEPRDFSIAEALRAAGVEGRPEPPSPPTPPAPRDIRQYMEEDLTKFLPTR